MAEDREATSLRRRVEELELQLGEAQARIRHGDRERERYARDLAWTNDQLASRKEKLAATRKKLADARQRLSALTEEFAERAPGDANGEPFAPLPLRPLQSAIRQVRGSTAGQSAALVVVLALGAGVIIAAALERQLLAIALVGWLVVVVFVAVVQLHRRVNQGLAELRRLVLEGRGDPERASAKGRSPRKD